MVAGPPGLRDRAIEVTEADFPGASETRHRFDLTMMELEDRQTVTIDGIRVTPFQVNVGRPGGPFFAYRIEAEGKVLAYTGDSEWSEALIDAGREADLFIAEAYFRDKQVPLHLDLATLEQRLDDIRPRRLVLTHMSESMLAEREDVPYQTAEDGMMIEF